MEPTPDDLTEAVDELYRRADQELYQLFRKLLQGEIDEPIQ